MLLRQLGAGWGMDPAVFLQQGDVVKVEIGGIGHIENTVVNGQAAG
jgi:2-keto-4-pentenoate hydratase/2-oxohepta-3-ene-1,7-dioic acid hydratase in catechol pathway